MKDGVFWSSAITKRRIWYRWECTIYRNSGDIKGSGGARSLKTAEESRDRWLISQGESP